MLFPDSSCAFFFLLAETLGIAPSPTVLETAMLLLHHVPISKQKAEVISCERLLPDLLSKRNGVENLLSSFIAEQIVHDKTRECLITPFTFRCRTNLSC